MDLLPFFAWFGQSPLAEVAKAHDGIFAVAQMLHLLALALLGGTAILGDLRLLGFIMADVPSEKVMRNIQGWFNLALAVAVLSGVFMSSATATRLYHNEMFWAKMVALGLGVIFVYGIRRPLLRFDHADIHPWALRLTAMTSLTLWLTVAACGCWIAIS